MDKDINIKKNIIGGFDKKQVMDYIDEISSVSDNKNMKKEIEENRRIINELNAYLNAKDKEIKILKSEINVIRADSPEINDTPPPSDDETGIASVIDSGQKIQSAKEEIQKVTNEVIGDLHSKKSSITSLKDKLSNITTEIGVINNNLNSLSEQINEVHIDNDEFDNVSVPPVKSAKEILEDSLIRAKHRNEKFYDDEGSEDLLPAINGNEIHESAKPDEASVSSPKAASDINAASDSPVEEELYFTLDF